MHKTEPITVIVGDGRQLMRDLLRAALANISDVHILAECDSLEDLMAECFRRSPQVVLLGIGSFAERPDVTVRAVLDAAPSAAVAVLSADDDDRDLLLALDAGACAFVTLESAIEELEDSLRAAAAHQTLLPPRFARVVLERLSGRPRVDRRSTETSLTARELEILHLLTDGLGNAEIARAVGLSSNTVKNHLYSIYRKLGVSSRSQAFAEATRRGLVQA